MDLPVGVALLMVSVSIIVPPIRVQTNPPTRPGDSATPSNRHCKSRLSFSTETLVLQLLRVFVVTWLRPEACTESKLSLFIGVHHPSSNHHRSNVRLLLPEYASPNIAP